MADLAPQRELALLRIRFQRSIQCLDEKFRHRKYQPNHGLSRYQIRTSRAVDVNEIRCLRIKTRYPAGETTRLPGCTGYLSRLKDFSGDGSEIKNTLQSTALSFLFTIPLGALSQVATRHTTWEWDVSRRGDTHSLNKLVVHLKSGEFHSEIRTTEMTALSWETI